MQYFTPKKTCKILSISRYTLLSIVKSGELKCVWVGKIRRFEPEEIEKYVHRNDNLLQSSLKGE